MTTPAGWYDDGSGSLRWWDGTQWTAHVRTTAAPVPSRAVEQPAAETAAEPAVEASTFAPPYVLSSSSPAGAPAGPTAATPPFAVAPAVGFPSAPASPAKGVPVLGIIGLTVVVVGVVCACVPVISGIGWGILALGFVLSLVSLFLRGRKWPGITGMAVAAVGAILAVAVSFITLGITSTTEGGDVPLAVPSERPPGEDGSDTEGSTDPSEIDGAEIVPFEDLEVGDCLPLVEYGDEEEIFDLPVVPCDRPHTDEIYFIFEVEDGDFPGDEALSDTAWDRCFAEFEGFVGVPYDVSELDFYSYQPTKTSWIRADDRTVHCIVFSYEDVTGTLQDAKH